MQTTNPQLAELQSTVQELARILAQTEARHARTMRHYRLLWPVMATFFIAILYQGGVSGPTAFAQSDPKQGMPAAQQESQTSAAILAKRAALLAQLPEEQQRELEEFQQQVEWVSQYMQTWDESQAGAIVALMLSRIGDNMDAVPRMHEEMQVMNSLMHSMPIVATEMQRMNASISVITANMGVMTHNMDSTMGRMGRWAPW